MYILLGVLLALLVIAAVVYFLVESAGNEKRSGPSTAHFTSRHSDESPTGGPDSAARLNATDASGGQSSGLGVRRAPFVRRARRPADEEIEYRAYVRPRSGTEPRWDPFAEEQSRVHRVRAARHRPSTLPDYYKLLGLERGATDVQVEQAYRRCAARIHPDRFHKDAEGRVAAEAQLKELNRAMEILRDPTRRAQYDALL